MSFLDWLIPTYVGPLDRATYRLRLVLAVQFLGMGLAIYLILWLGRGEHPAIVVPELVAHVALGIFLWTAFIRWYTMILVAAGGVTGMALGGAATVEVLTIFFVLPLTLLFYKSTRSALATQIIIWNMVAWTGAGMAFTASDRLHWSTFLIEASAIGIISTLMVILRLSLVKLTGTSQRLENLITQYQMIHERRDRATLILNTSGDIVSIHGKGDELLGMQANMLHGRSFASIAMKTNPPVTNWEPCLGNKHHRIDYNTWLNVNDKQPIPVKLQIESGSSIQRRNGMAVFVDISSTDPKSI